MIILRRYSYVKNCAVANLNQLRKCFKVIISIAAKSLAKGKDRYDDGLIIHIIRLNIELEKMMLYCLNKHKSYTNRWSQNLLL